MNRFILSSISNSIHVFDYVGWVIQQEVYQRRMKNQICTHNGTRCQNANAANATHLL